MPFIYVHTTTPGFSLSNGGTGLDHPMRYILPKYPNFHYPTIPNMKNTNPSAHYQRWPSILTWESHGYDLDTTASFHFYLVCHTHWSVSTKSNGGTNTTWIGVPSPTQKNEYKHTNKSNNKSLPYPEPYHLFKLSPQHQPVHPNQQLRPRDPRKAREKKNDVHTKASRDHSNANILLR